jgi:predicted nuclease of restriction endonuclease-like (RecB) superfamily
MPKQTPQTARASTPTDPLLPAGYDSWLASLKARISTSRVRAATAANCELVMLYWDIGREILARQGDQGWGSKVVERLAADLRSAFPDMKGLSRANLMYMRAFAAAWPEREFVQAVLGQLPWYHQIALLEKVSAPEQRRWYARAAIEHGWSRNVLVHQIDTRLIDRAGAAVTNFASALPSPRSDLAQQLTRDPHIFDFLGLGQRFDERELEDALVSRMQRFLLELGKGFAFVGRQYRLEVGGQDFYIDLLFYHLRLHCYVAVELKVGEFRPEYAGKMQFYLTALDSEVKTQRDDASIGLILCQSRNTVVAEYALRDSARPMGVAEYRVELPDRFAADLPSVAQLTAVITARADQFVEDASLDARMHVPSLPGDASEPDSGNGESGVICS